MKNKFWILLVITCLISVMFFSGTVRADDFWEIVRRGNPEEVRAAIEAGAEVRQENAQGQTPLMIAAGYNRNPRVAEILLDEGAIMEARDNRGRTPLYYAVEYNSNESVLRTLVRRGAAVNIRTNEGYTPLLRAVNNNEREKIVILLHSGGRVDQRGPDGRTPLFLLLKHNPSLSLVRRFLHAGASPASRDDRGRTPYHEAAEREQKDILEIFSERVSAVDLRDNQQVTPFMLAAAQNDDRDVLRFLLSRNADINARDRKGRTPILWAAAENSSLRVLEFLLEQGAEISAVDDNKRGVIHHAVASAQKSHDKIQLFTQYNDIDFNLLDRDGNAPLHLALNQRSLQYRLIQLLLSSGADPNLENHTGHTPLMQLAKDDRNPRFFSLLLESGADVNKAGRLGITPLMLAARNTDNEDVIFTLLEAGAEVDVSDNRGRKVVDYLDENRDLLDTDAYWELQYMEPEERKLDKLEFKSPVQGTVRSLAVPSLGHAYADSWWPKGALFLTGEAVTLGLALTREDRSSAAPFYLAFAVLKALEIYDVNREISSFNELAEGYNQRVEEFNRRFQE